MTTETINLTVSSAVEVINLTVSEPSSISITPNVVAMVDPRVAAVLTEAQDAAATISASVASATASASAASASATAAASSETNAASSASAAATSASSASTSASTASTQATNAASSASAASTSATNAATSASNASTSATNAASSATSAGSSATAAGTSSTNAANSATGAANSASSASTSASSASASASNAATSEANALTYKNAAATSATNAATSESNALTYKNNASTSATNAATSEANALAYKNAAATSATNAATSETNAANSATSAANSATAAAAAAGLTAKGDLLTHDGTANARLAVGTNDYVLIADSAQVKGVKWGVNTPADATVTKAKLATGAKDLATASKTTAYTVANTDEVVFCDASSAAFTVTLPTAAGVTGRIFVIKKTDSSFNSVTIATTSSQTIDGDSTKKLSTKNESMALVSNGSGWYVLSRQIPGKTNSYTPTGSWTTNTTYTGYWYREGEYLVSEVQVALAGAPNSAMLTVNLPSGLTIDTAKLTNSTQFRNSIGLVNLWDFSAGSFCGVVGYNTTTSVLPMRETVSGSFIGLGSVDQATPFTFAVSDKVTLNYRVPIVGWDL